MICDCHLAACALAHVIPSGQLYHEIVATGRDFLPGGYIDRELKGDCGAVLRRAVAASEGRRVEFDGRMWDTRYSYSKASHIEMLGIQPHEERHMTRLISDGEKERRRVERRREAGVIERAAYEAPAAARRAKVVELRARGLTWRAIGAELGISEGEARRLARTDA